MKKVLFVCLGNICRSPAAEGTFRHWCQNLGSEQRFFCDSAGTAAYHIGKSADTRMRKAAKARGIDIDSLRARQLCIDDFYQFDIIVAMDHSNMANVQAVQPVDGTASLLMMLDYPGSPMDEVPDPYYGGDEGFDEVFNLLDHACRHLHDQFC